MDDKTIAQKQHEAIDVANIAMRQALAVCERLGHSTEEGEQRLALDSLHHAERGRHAAGHAMIDKLETATETNALALHYIAVVQRSAASVAAIYEKVLAPRQ